MVSQWSLSNSKYPQVSRTLLSILADLNYTIVRMVHTLVYVPPRSILVLLFPSLPTPFPILSRLSPVHQPQLILPSPLCSIVFFSSLARSRYFLLSFIFILWFARTAKSTIQQALCLCGLSLGLVVWPRLGCPFVSQNHQEVCTSHFPGWMLGCVCTICSYGQISISCTTPSGLPSPLNYV